jgi:hypothetical protein
LKKDKDERHYVRASQWATVLLTVISAVVTFYLESIGGAWRLLLGVGAGTGLVLLLRWYWWRINAWSEVSAMTAAFVVSTALHLAGWNSDDPRDFAWIMIVTVSVTTVTWLAVTFLTPPERMETLLAFYRRTRPSLVGWRTVAGRAPDVTPSRDGWYNLLDWMCGVVLIYGWLFGIGKLLFGETLLGLALIAAGMAAGAVIYWDLSRRGWSSVAQ